MSKSQVHELLYELLDTLPVELTYIIVEYIVFLPTNKKWEVEKDVYTHAYNKDIGLICGDGLGELTCIDIITGKILWNYQLSCHKTISNILVINTTKLVVAAGAFHLILEIIDKNPTKLEN